jgi:toxin ParE1/3/4
MQEIDFLVLKPISGRKQDHIRKGYLSSKVKSYYIFYRFTTIEIEIVRILHESMDIPNRLNE